MPSESVFATMLPFFEGDGSYATSSHGSVTRDGRWLYSYAMPISVRIKLPSHKFVYVVVPHDCSPSTTTKKHISQATQACEQAGATLLHGGARLPNPEAGFTDEHIAHEVAVRMFLFAQQCRGGAYTTKNTDKQIELAREASQLIHSAERLRKAFDLEVTMAYVNNKGADRDRVW